MPDCVIVTAQSCNLDTGDEAITMLGTIRPERRAAAVIEHDQLANEHVTLRQRINHLLEARCPVAGAIADQPDHP